MVMMEQARNWVVEKDADHILWLKLDCLESTVNTLNREVLEELLEIIEGLTLAEIKGVIISSLKPSGFIAGADIEQFADISDVNEAVILVREGQKIFDRIAHLPIPTVAMIGEGFCLGGGLELALACRYRVAQESDKTRLGLPEVKLGIHPGWGGTIRLPQMIGAINALDLILSGRTVTAQVAKKMGFVDECVPKRHLVRAAKHFILNFEPVHEASFLQKLSNALPMRYIIASYLRYKISAKVDAEQYPAPFAVIENWLKYGVKSEAAYIHEAHSIGKLILSDTCKNLVRVFYLQEELKILAKDENFTPNHIHIIGAGVMGGDIAAWCALKGLIVTLQDKEPKFIADTIKRAYKLFKKKLHTPRQIEAAMDRLRPDREGAGIIQADMIIEAIFEDLAEKQAIFKEIEQYAKANAIFATNTSSILLEDINCVLDNPSRLVGIHFFNPVWMMPLVEVVGGKQTDPAILKRAIAFVRRIDKLPLPVKSSPGFLVNRLLMPYLVEALKLVEEGIPLLAIDQAAVEFGMPMGPIELADTVGLDVCLASAHSLSPYFSLTIPALLVKKVEKGELGKKTGKGFYRYKNGKPVKEQLAKTYTLPADVVDRLIFSMQNEAAKALREHVVQNEDSVDAAMIFGAGFPPFRGGPMRYAQEKGIHNLVGKSAKLQEHYGDRFKLDSFWEQKKLTLSEQV